MTTFQLERIIITPRSFKLILIISIQFPPLNTSLQYHGHITTDDIFGIWKTFIQMHISYPVLLCHKSSGINTRNSWNIHIIPYCSLMQKRHNSIANTLELCLFCIEPTIFAWIMVEDWCVFERLSVTSRCPNVIQHAAAVAAIIFVASVTTRYPTPRHTYHWGTQQLLWLPSQRMCTVYIYIS